MELVVVATTLLFTVLRLLEAVEVVYTTVITPEAAAREGAVSFLEGLVHQAKAKTEVVDTLKPMLPLIRAAEAEGRQQMAATALQGAVETVETDYLPQ
jgi:hypothetical protein